ncbi:uncharacterized protein LAESUDRAFT_765334 [Laetiporus sulphureus 93-53]|uniref:ABC transmembrane type-1 domain-containing protein n=1 Tax=Laetiporus sulphureus 93-53 TaxID=1314785 RepID=A0A165ATB3_9APHY|nr:uncharacterized protein LAESUDRAFT_765334 [Laetiporus sulphureus 93-53]KZS99623.1 hypothetical protein LAESUDRAFT_765334 [Laetiporus sulphureus 93-53]
MQGLEVSLNPRRAFSSRRLKVTKIMWNPLHPLPAPPDFGEDVLTDVVEREFYARCSPYKRPRFLRQAETNKNDRLISEQSARFVTIEDEKRISDTKPVIDEKKDIDVEANATATEELSQRTETSDTDHRYDESLLKALHNAYLNLWWTAGFLTLVGTMLNTQAAREQMIDKPKGVGYGVGLAFALCHARGLQSGNISSHRTCDYSLKLLVPLCLSARARLEHSMGNITTMISTDATRLKKNRYYAHNLWIAPLQIIIGVALRLKALGYSGLVGFSVMILGLPAELICAFALFKQCSMGVVLTDKRVRAIIEVLLGIRLIKFFSWEGFFAHKASTTGQKEVHRITYALSGHTLNVSIIFTSLQFLNVHRHHRVHLANPSDFTDHSDAADNPTDRPRTRHGLRRRSKAYPQISPNVEGDFTWDTAHKPAEENISDTNANAWNRLPERLPPPRKPERRFRCLGKRKKDSRDNKGELGQAPQEGAASAADDGKKNEKPFELKGLLKSRKDILLLSGSGKSSLLHALIGEMRRVSGHAMFSSQIAYVPQTPWIINATTEHHLWPAG